MPPLHGILRLGLAIVTVACMAAADDPATTLADAGELEAQTLDRLLTGDAWTRRALASMRLDRYRCAASREILQELTADEAWQVRAFAIRALGRRGEVLAEDAFGDEFDPKVLRSALRHGYAIDTERIGRGVRYLARSGNLQEKMLAVELGIASGDDELAELARQTIRTIILRMKRAEAGVLSPRLSAVTGAPDLRRPYRWRKWLRKAGKRFALRPALALSGDEAVPSLLGAELGRRCACAAPGSCRIRKGSSPRPPWDGAGNLDDREDGKP